MTTPEPALVEDPDIVQVVLQRVLAAAPEFNRQLAEQIDREVRAQYGGLRVRIPKRGKYLTQQQREAAYADAVSNMPTTEVMRKHKISLATLYRLTKNPPR